MKRLILILLILGLCCTISSAGITDKLKSVIARQTVAGGAACAGTLGWSEEQNTMYEYNGSIATQYTASGNTTFDKLCARTDMSDAETLEISTRTNFTT